MIHFLARRRDVADGPFFDEVDVGARE